MVLLPVFFDATDKAAIRPPTIYPDSMILSIKSTFFPFFASISAIVLPPGPAPMTIARPVNPSERGICRQCCSTIVDAEQVQHPELGRHPLLE
jgi:hypothetical protein